MAKVTIEYFGVEGTGKNVTEAKRDAGRKIETALSGSYTPEVLAWRGNAILVWREPGGWCHRLIVATDDVGIREGRVWGCPEGDYQSAVKSAQAQLAQLGWEPEDGDAPPPFLTERGAVADFRSWVLFQERCLRARAAGLEDWEAHNYGCGALGRPDLVERVEGAPAA